MARLFVNVGLPLVSGGLAWALTGNFLLGLILAAAMVVGRLLAAWRYRPH